jgi:Ligase-CoA domain
MPASSASSASSKRQLAELSYIMPLLTTCGERLGSRVGIISASGGACSLIADHTVDAGLELPELPDALQETLNRSIPEYGSSLNPVDLSADVISRVEILDGTLAALSEGESIDVWLVFGRPVVDRYYQAFIDFARNSGKAVIVSCGVPIAPEIHSALREGGIAVLQDPELCLRALGRIQRSKRRSPSSASLRDPHGERMDHSSSPGAERKDRFAGSPLLSPPPQAEEEGASAAPHGSSPSAALRDASSPSPALLGKVGMGASIIASIEHDRDFGSVLTFTTSHARARVVRALPATDDDLRDALGQIAETTPSQTLIEQLQRFIASARPGARTDLNPEA